MELNKKKIRKTIKEQIKSLMEALPKVKDDDVPVGYNEMELDELATELGYLEGHNKEDKEEKDDEDLANVKGDMATMGEGRTTDGMTPEIKATWDRYAYGDYKQGIKPKIGCCDGYEIMDHDNLTIALDNDEKLQSILSAMDERTAAR